MEVGGALRTCTLGTVFSGNKTWVPAWDPALLLLLALDDLHHLLEYHVSTHYVPMRC